MTERHDDGRRRAAGARGGRLARVVAVTVVAAAAVAGCATGPRLVRTAVTSFDTWSTLPADRSYAFARTLEYRDSLEVAHYEDLVRAELDRRGFAFDADATRATLVVTLRPSETGTTVRVREPRWGGWGGVGPYGGFGPWGGLYGRRFGWYDPLWNEGTGWDSDFPIEIVNRRLELDIDSRTTPVKRYYEGRVESSGEADSLARAMPALVRALFTDFPGDNGRTRRVDVPVARRTGLPVDATAR